MSMFGDILFFLLFFLFVFLFSCTIEGIQIHEKSYYMLLNKE